VPTEHSCSPEAQLSSPAYTKAFSGLRLSSSLVPALAGVQGSLPQPQSASQAAARTLLQLNTSPEEYSSDFYITPAHGKSLGWEQNQGWAPCIK